MPQIKSMIWDGKCIERHTGQKCQAILSKKNTDGLFPDYIDCYPVIPNKVWEEITNEELAEIDQIINLPYQGQTSLIQHTTKWYKKYKCELAGHIFLYIPIHQRQKWTTRPYYSLLHYQQKSFDNIKRKETNGADVHILEDDYVILVEFVKDTAYNIECCNMSMFRDHYKINASEEINATE